MMASMAWAAQTAAARRRCASPAPSTARSQTRIAGMPGATCSRARMTSPSVPATPPARAGRCINKAPARYCWMTRRGAALPQGGTLARKRIGDAAGLRPPAPT
jgi:hypothetical protein